MKLKGILDFSLGNFHFLRAWVLKERHSRGCLCSYCKDFAPHHADYDPEPSV